MIRFKVVYLACVLSLGCLSGCGRFSTEYGDSAGPQGRSSINGFGALRQSFENAGFENRDITRLTERMTKTDTIVWTPSHLVSFHSDVTSWLDRWLTMGGRTLVFVVPDSGSEADYWIDASRMAPPEQRLEYRRRAARSMNERMVWRLNREPLVSNGWIHAAPLAVRHKTNSLNGPWAESFPDEKSQFELEYDIAPSTDPTTQGAKPTQVFSGTKKTGPGAAKYVYQGTTSESSTDVSITPALQDDAGTTIISEVTSPQWKDSKIIVVSGGSLLTNYAFTDPANVILADKIVRTSLEIAGENPKAGFIKVDAQSLPVSDSKPGIPKASGWELLTTWPISLVMIHLVLLLIVALLSLLPSLGRPRKVVYNSVSNFGDHLDAIAVLMRRAGGEDYARNRISEYMKRVHGETNGPWIVPEQAEKK